jgi:protease-4
MRQPAKKRPLKEGKGLLENFDVSLAEPSVLSALDGLARHYGTFTDNYEPKALLTCDDCLVDLD